VYLYCNHVLSLSERKKHAGWSSVLEQSNCMPRLWAVVSGSGQTSIHYGPRPVPLCSLMLHHLSAGSVMLRSVPVSASSPLHRNPPEHNAFCTWSADLLPPTAPAPGQQICYSLFLFCTWPAQAPLRKPLAPGRPSEAPLPESQVPGRRSQATGGTSQVPGCSDPGSRAPVWVTGSVDGSHESLLS